MKKNLKILKNAGSSSNTSKEIYIQYKNYSNLIKLLGFDEETISVSEFISKARDAHQEFEYSQQTLADETLSNLNITKTLHDFQMNHLKLTQNGLSDIDATMKISTELQRNINNELLNSQKKAVCLSSTKQLANLKNMLITAILKSSNSC